ncbi:VOC family protein [Sphingopyxis terrae]|uniref:VOC family protein n=1 Tax=Sphingopyxis terrae TaxID=33052 RepID=UPI002A13C3C1|nr:VOC family protein [Sphingopyxis terrae]MDX8356419.1 VOC family protein [Sphingopyxis terrae]
MYSHIMVGSNDLDRSQRFYDATFAAIGRRGGSRDPKGRLIYVHEGSVFMVTKPIDGDAATPGNGMTIGFQMDGPEQAEAWHAAGVSNGGTAIEEAPGVRSVGALQLYLAYLRDPDGNKLCAFHRVAA